MIKLCRELTGKILDVGGGGEGVIGRLYTDHVIAIDNRKEELDEAPEGFKKMLMDATDMSFDDNTFDCVTAFYSLMFMNEKNQEKALSESARVLKEGGELHIWDCDIDSAYPEPFCIDVVVELPDERLSVTYGICKQGRQSKGTIMDICTNVGLRFVAGKTDECGFYLRFIKED